MSTISAVLLAVWGLFMVAWGVAMLRRNFELAVCFAWIAAAVAISRIFIK
jgi:hypothetical protein